MSKKSEKDQAPIEAIVATELAIVPREMNILVRPLVTPEAAKAEFQNYLELCRAILDESDYTYYVHYANKEGKEERPAAYSLKELAEKKAKDLINLNMQFVYIKERKKRSAWDKLARFFGLTLPQIDDAQTELTINEVGNFIIETRRGRSFTLIIYQKKEDLEIVKASATVSVTAPGGRIAVGDGVCSVHERAKGAESFAHADHDIPTTAFTRALNRAVSRCIGTGETSAEEVGADSPAGGQPSGQAIDSAPAAVASPKTETVKPADVAEKQKEKHADPPAESKKKEEKKDPPTQAASTPAFVSLGDTASFQERITFLENWMYGNASTRDTTRPNQLVKYALFLVPEPHKVDIETNQKRWDGPKWKAEMLKLSKEERTKRVSILEKLATDSNPTEFLAWATKAVNDLWG